MVLPEDLVILMEPSEHGRLHGQVVDDLPLADQAGEGGVGVRNIPPGLLEHDRTGSGEQETPRAIRLVTLEGLDEPVVLQRATQFIGRFGRQAQAGDEELERGTSETPRARPGPAVCFLLERHEDRCVWDHGVQYAWDNLLVFCVHNLRPAARP